MEGWEAIATRVAIRALGKECCAPVKSKKAPSGASSRTMERGGLLAVASIKFARRFDACQERGVRAEK